MTEELVVETFIRDAPLYSERSFNSQDVLKPLYCGFRFDGYCPDCKKEATFSVAPFENNWHSRWVSDYGSDLTFLRFFTASCTRNTSHQQSFVIRYSQGNRVAKIGQYPSLADIQIDANRQYRSVLEKEDSTELYRAIGLAAHGVGIGSFVYLRRIFERLVYTRFEKHKDAERWTDESFQSLRMDEKIALLKNYLPSFLVESKKIYGILSSGIHTLDEKKCLDFFPVLLKSIQLILDEDKKAKEEAALKDDLKRAIQDFENTEPTKNKMDK